MLLNHTKSELKNIIHKAIKLPFPNNNHKSKKYNWKAKKYNRKAKKYNRKAQASKMCLRIKVIQNEKRKDVIRSLFLIDIKYVCYRLGLVCYLVM